MSSIDQQKATDNCTISEAFCANEPQKHFCLLCSILPQTKGPITLTGNLSWLYTSDMRRLWLRVFLIFMMRTMAASIWYCRSWKTLSVVLACSSTCSDTKTSGVHCRHPRWRPHEHETKKLYRLFHLDLINFDAEQPVFEFVIAGELITVLHIFAFGDFGQDTRFATC